MFMRFFFLQVQQKKNHFDL